ncbi:MAG: integrase core domain-containing protein [Pseudomonadota bacterium]
MRTRAKPAWVREELIALAARSTLSCRTLAEVFNRRHADQGMRVGKTFVAELLKRHHAEIACHRRRLRPRHYRAGRRNVVWGLDGTGKIDAQRNLHFLLGIVDHGSRRCVTLEALADKRSVTVVRALCDAVEQHGAPRAIRTDNEAIFQSRVFKTALKVLGIRHQTTELHCPWQNGRIERFFGTLKDKLDRWAVADGLALQASLRVFRLWYNHVRTHQHLGGRTPIEAWNNTDIRHRPKRRVWFEGWDGLLQGEYLQR